MPPRLLLALLLLTNALVAQAEQPAAEEEAPAESADSAEAALLPLQVGRQWAYDLSSGATRTIEVVEMRQSPTTDEPASDGEAPVTEWDLTGLDARDPTRRLTLRQVEDGYTVLGEQRVGYAGTLQLVPLMALRWGDEGEYSVETMTGCIVHSVTTRLTGEVQLQVMGEAASGTRLEVEDQSFTLVAGVGIALRTVTGEDGQEVVWTLRSVRTVVEDDPVDETAPAPPEGGSSR